MDAATKQLVRGRAGGTCEYCLARQADDPFLRFQIEHIIAVQHGGSDDPDNLALACPHCNQHKGPNLTGLDPFDGALTRLFDPRRQRWEDHFAVRGPLVMGLTAVGRTTVRVLNMNAQRRVEARANLSPPTA